MDESEKISWHPAFVQGVQAEFEEYKDALTFEVEHQLTAEPLKIDLVILKKKPNAVIRKNIGEIFKGVNIFEYKSPSDYMSVSDFYKVRAYANLYCAQRKDGGESFGITDLTISVVVTKYPDALIKHLEETLGCNVDEKSNGIYCANGLDTPFQIIQTEKLPEDETVFLKGLSRDSGAEFLKRILSICNERKVDLAAYKDVILRANAETINALREVDSDMAMTLEQALEGSSVAAKFERRGELRGKAEEFINVFKFALSISLEFAEQFKENRQKSDYVVIVKDKLSQNQPISKIADAMPLEIVNTVMGCTSQEYVKLLIRKFHRLEDGGLAGDEWINNYIKRTE